MLFANALKTICDLLLYFSFAALFKIFGGSWPVVGAVVAIAFVSTLIVQKAKGALPARIICGLLPFAGLFAARNMSDLIIAAIPIMFYAAMTFADKIDIHYEEYKFWFGIPAIPVAVLFFICFGQWPIRPEATAYAAIYLFLGVLVLRLKRVGEGAKLKHRLINFAEMFVVLVLGILACVTIYEIVMHSGRVVEVIFMPVGAIFFALVSGISWLFDQALKPKPEDKVIKPKDPDVQQIEKQDAVEEVSSVAEGLNYDVIEIVIAALLVLLAIVLLILLLRWFYRTVRGINNKKNGAALEMEDGEAEESTSFFGFKRKKKKPQAETNNAKIRQIYKEYLFFVKTFGVKIVNQTTSEDVAIASDEIIETGKADELRQLYIRARYNDDNQLSDEEVLRAQTLFEEIKNQIEDKMR